MQKFKFFIAEGRVSPEFLKKNNVSIDTSHDPSGYKDSSDIIDHFVHNADPTDDKVYSSWIVNRYKKKQFIQNDAPEISKTLDTFHRFKNKLESKDINSYKSLDDLKSAVEPYLNAESNKQRKRRQKEEGVDLIHDDEQGTSVRKILTHNAACSYGSGTKWCTNNPNDSSYFEKYKDQGNLFVINTKDGNKFQYHPYGEESELKDEKNKSVDPFKLVKKHPELKNVDEFQNLHPAFFKGSAEEALENPDEYYQAEVVRGRKDITPAAIQKLLKHSDQDVRTNAVLHPSNTEDTLRNAFQDSSYRVRSAVLKHPNVPDDLLVRGLIAKDKNDPTPISAASNPRTSNEEILKHINNPDVRFGAIQNPNISPEIVKGIADKEEDSRQYFKLMSVHPKVKELAKNLNLTENKILKFRFFLNEDLTDNNFDRKAKHYFDIDETLFAHDHSKLRVHVKDPTGKRVRTLTNQEFNTHQLPADHSYDFSEFRSSEIFNQSAKPIRKMIAKMKSMKQNGADVEMLTARSDLDNKPKFAALMNKYGIDITPKTGIHVRRAGNMAGKPADTKAAHISDAIQKEKLSEVHLYDDSIDNIKGMLKLKKQFPDVTFHGHHVQHDPETGNVNITRHSSTDKKGAN
jgi:hypothetical protein